jgi:hypothetical protein
VSAAAAQQALIPPAAGFDVRDTDEWLGPHGFYVNRTRDGGWKANRGRLVLQQA